jgi:hypothetical protein
VISSTALADTSFFVARETGRPMATAMSRGILISTITIASCLSAFRLLAPKRIAAGGLPRC